MIFSGIVGAVVLPRVFFHYGYSYAHMIGFMCIVACISCVFSGFSSDNLEVMFAIFFAGIGFGTLPALSAQIANEAPAEQQGRVNGFNYAVSTAAWATSPYAFWALYEGYVDDDLTTHENDIASSLWWWVSAGLFFLAAIIMLCFLQDSTEKVLKHTGKNVSD